MKLFISADIEGVTGVTSWTETNISNPESRPFIKQMEKEVNAVCEGAFIKGFNEIVVKDAHETGRNMDIHAFPEYVRLNRGWSGHPLAMIEGVDNTFEAMAFVGYHSGASKGTSPLSHSMHVSKINQISINGMEASEFLIFYYAGLYVGVPTIFVSGDEGICEEVHKVNPNIITVSTKEGFGKGTINKNPQKVLNHLKEAFNTLELDKEKYMEPLPDEFVVEINFKNPSIAYWASFYPTAKQINDTTIRYISKDYMKVLTMFSFLIQ
ncbi:D-amino peptidase [Natranaerovirga hydrolytica]|uniref:D-amino peptidase n=1 Tax=Natranaerovirga hydrolytica TaxID=680378 RepID=A0A4V2Q1Q7_9FIRM|nr:M55 family metallopeptidase [Natranaerovirga hydrolytica]TCK98561.1 D-amino peptidase [Natranaerovirga hydrolytica]